MSQKSLPGEGTYFLLMRNDAKELFGLDGDDAVWRFVEKIRTSPQHRKDDLVLDCGTAWDPIHRVLTDGTLSHDAGEFPNDHCVLGGRRMYEGADCEVIMVRPDVVSLVAESLLQLRRGEFSEKYMALDPEQYGQTPTETDGDTLWSMFKLIRSCSKKPAMNMRQSSSRLIEQATRGNALLRSAADKFTHFASATWTLRLPAWCYKTALRAGRNFRVRGSRSRASLGPLVDQCHSHSPYHEDEQEKQHRANDKYHNREYGNSCLHTM